jgi:intracellular multiplication protein IcmP
MPPQQQQSGSDENGPLWLAGLALVSILAIWFTMHDWLTLIYLKLKWAELLLFNPFTHHFQILSAQLSTLTLAQAKTLPLSSTLDVGAQVGKILRYPLLVILAIFVLKLYFGSAAVQFRSTYDMQKLASEEVVNWPQISPTLSLDLVDTPLDEGPWAFSLNPMLFAKKYNLLVIQQELSGEEQLSSAVKVKVSLKRLEAKQVFLMQLGNYWQGPEKLPMYTRALLAMFMAKAHGDAKAVTALSSQIAVSAAKTQGKNINYNGVDQLLEKYFNEKDVQRVIRKHAFVYTVMASMLEFARRDGVYASSDFLWLKPIDRRLWYTLNCAGRKTPFSEVAGIFAHREAEKLYNKPLFMPMVDEAVDALESALADILFKPEEQ